MEFIRIDKACSKCATDMFPIKNEKVGKSVFIREPFGRGSLKTLHEYFQCQDCGSIWQKITDSGVGGHDWHTYRLTKGFF